MVSSPRASAVLIVSRSIAREEDSPEPEFAVLKRIEEVTVTNAILDGGRGKRFAALKNHPEKKALGLPLITAHCMSLGAHTAQPGLDRREIVVGLDLVGEDTVGAKVK